MILKPMGTPGKCPAHLRAWTAEDDELLINLYPSMKKAECNLTFREISEKFDMHPAVCWKLYTYRQTAADAIAREYLPR
ncbi:hypothetical protein Q3P76_003135 [Salmonella enterica]|nr:hypothetical protein [Salmonella enterica]EDS8078982.1 hypothetical protein [Salmonella enterica subsp. enterica]EAX9513736.1 hypothetical protein [Salmonella enterica]EDY7006913.1 hypothetical protein [Salmonella enterica]EHF6043423.1 hypothetical protein [Salmonella enterica]